MGSEFDVGLFPVYKQLFRTFLRTAMLKMCYDYKIILLEKGLEYKNKNIHRKMNFDLYRYYTTFSRYLVL